MQMITDNKMKSSAYKQKKKYHEFLTWNKNHD